jgi:hypothetical protein
VPFPSSCRLFVLRINRFCKLHTVSQIYLIRTFFLPIDPLLKSSLPYWSIGLIAQFLDLSQAVGLLGRVISSSKNLYLNTGQHKHRKILTHNKHPCPRRDSNPQSRPPSYQRLFMPQIPRLPRPAFVQVNKLLKPAVVFYDYLAKEQQSF